MSRFFTRRWASPAWRRGGTQWTRLAVTRLPANGVCTHRSSTTSLQRVDFKRGTLLRGPTGQRGPQGTLLPGCLSVRSKGAEISPTAGVDYERDRHLPRRLIPVRRRLLANFPVYVMLEMPQSLGWHVRVRSTARLSRAVSLAASTCTRTA